MRSSSSELDVLNGVDGQVHKLELLGKLAGGIAHDFNNLLTVINGCCQLLAVRHQEDDESRELLEQIEKAGDRATLLTRQLLSFSRNHRIDPVVLNLNDLIANSVTILRRLITENIRLTTKLQPDLWNVKADAGQVEQIVLNLAINARDAMPKGGELQIETDNVVLDDGPRTQDRSVPNGNYVRLVVRDSGVGMTEDVLSHIFEPFFTTKAVGKGTGLGLATVCGILQRVGGHVTVASKPGVGTRFKVFFPSVREAVSHADQPCPVLARPLGEGTILIAEDEPGVRSLASQVLRQQGFVVLEAENGREALTCCNQHPGKVDLVITDVVMPIMSGPILGAALRRRFPEVKILYVSGYTDSLLAPHDEVDIKTAFLQKPFTPDDLLEAVRLALAPRSLAS